VNFQYNTTTITYRIFKILQTL